MVLKHLNWEVQKTTDRSTAPLIYSKFFNKPTLTTPLFNDFEKKSRKAILFERSKMRTLMKGIKIGAKKGGSRVNIQSIVSSLK